MRLAHLNSRCGCDELIRSHRLLGINMTPAGRKPQVACSHFWGMTALPGTQVLSTCPACSGTTCTWSGFGSMSDRQHCSVSSQEAQFSVDDQLLWQGATLDNHIAGAGVSEASCHQSFITRNGQQAASRQADACLISPFRAHCTAS